MRKPVSPVSVTRPNPGLTDQQRRAAKALANGATREDAALDAGVSRRTLSRWLTLPGVRDEIDVWRQNHGQTATEFEGKSVNDALPVAIREMIKILNDPEARATTKVSAARVVVSAWDRAGAWAELDAQLDEIEGREHDPAG